MTLRTALRSTGVIGLTACMLILSFPGLDLHFLAWVALLPLLLLIKQAGAWKAFLSALAVGFIMYSGLLWWTLKLHAINPANFSLTMLYNGCYLGLFGLAAYGFNRTIPQWNALTFPTTWVVLEYLRSHVGFLAFPWGILGYSQYAVLPVASLSALTGVYGVSFLIVAVNTALAEMVAMSLAVLRAGTPPGIAIYSRPKTTAGTLTGVLLLLSASLLYGSPRTTRPTPANTLHVALAQGNVYWDESRFASFQDYARTIFQTYSRLTLRASGGNLDLIVWPASSVPGRLPNDRILFRMLSELARRTRTFLLVGSSGYNKFSGNRTKLNHAANSAFLFAPQGDIVGRYDKIRLLPFDEYLPLRGVFKWPSWLVHKEVKDFTPGKTLTVFNLDEARFSVLICWENLFPDQFRTMVAQGVDFMVSMTNEAFTDVPAAHYQMLAMNVFRAIENRVAIVRTAPTGVSALIEPNGRISARVRHDDTDVNIAGYLIARLPLSSERTLYTRYGDWFIYSLFIVLVGFVGFGYYRHAHQCQER